RFNKSQQDAFLHHVENGLITLIGATTENPSFEVIPALLSRCRVVTLKRLEPEELGVILDRAMKDEERGFGRSGLEMDPGALDYLARIADGDARSALNGLEIAVSMFLAGEGDGKGGSKKKIELADVEAALQEKALLYDKSGEEHYNLISALHKSLRDSDPDAALYWLGRMLAAGEDPLFVARRMVRFASEDVGNADPRALQVALNAMESFRFLGTPEGELALAQAAAYLATAPKSNSIYTAYGDVMKTVKKTGALPVPLHIRNAPTRLMKNLGYGQGYKYAHDHKDAVVLQEHLPDQLAGRRFYFPTDRGDEKIIKNRLDRWRELKRRLRAEQGKD
ncbi:MAG: replication-associated recombination protein A, partial [Desulfobacterales bacterium]|nr:replication-associated recombination protein A [Desulfobacterales bacterium]